MKYTAKSFLQPGSAIEAQDEDKKIHKGLVQQSNPDGAMIVQLAGQPHPVFVWAPAPKAEASSPAPAAAATGKDVKKLADLQTEVKRLEDLAEGQAAQIKALTEQIAAKSAPVVPPPGPAEASDDPEGKDHFGT